jgi:hypothetical protein
VPSSPCLAVVGQIFALAAIRVVDAAVQHEFRRALFERSERNFAEHRNRIVIELAPGHRIDVAEQRRRIAVPAPPEIAREGPEALLHRRDETIEAARLADDGRDLRRGLHQHAHFIFAEIARFRGLNDQYALQDSAIDQRNAEKSFVAVFAGFAKIFESRMFLCVSERERSQLFGDQTRETFVQCHSQSADALGFQAARRREYEIRSVRLKQVNRADVGLESPSDKSDYVAERFGRLTAVFSEIPNFFESQNVLRVARMDRLAQARMSSRVTDE